MRNLVTAVLTVLALCMGPPAAAQEPPREAPAPAVSLPDRPIPYTKIRPRPPAAKAGAPRAARTAPASAAAAAPTAVAGAAPTVAALPRLSTGARLAPGQPLDPAELEAFVDGWVEAAMTREHIAGATISIVQNGQVILKKGYGFADLDPRRRVDPDRTLFRIGSVSKTFTWILLMKEVEAGRIRLDRPVNLYLPEKVRVRDQGQTRDVLVGHLLDHTGGFEDRALGQLFERDPRRVRPLDLYLRQERPRRVREPGLVSSYSNYGAALAGQAVSFVSNKTFELRVEEDITRPLGMSRTTFREPRPARRGLPAPMAEALRPDQAKGYGWGGAGYYPFDYEFIGHVAPAGSASSTAGDMSRYMLMLLGDGSWNGVTVFGPRAARAFRTPLRASGVGINGWAHGFMTFDLPGGHRGYGHLGHTLAFQSNMTLVPGLGLGVFVSTNSSDGEKLADILPREIVRHFYAPVSHFPRPGSPELARYADAFEGFYLPTRRAYGGLEGFVGLLSGGTEVAVTPGGRLITRRDGETKVWAPEGPVGGGRFISATTDERLAFRLQDGRAHSFREAANTERLEPAAYWERPGALLALGALVALAAVATLLGLILRNRRELRQNQIQARAALVQNIQAGLWLAAILLFLGWAAGAGDVQKVVYDWPSPLIVTASASALVAGLLTLITVAALPAVWQGGRRVDSWTPLRKVFFTLTVLIYAAFSVVLAVNGALEPWSG